MTTTTARVDVLTAEVRVLMVGSRQVTLSVYRQLDLVEPGQLDPFGRVNASRSDPDDGEWIETVGVSTRARDAGALVRSSSRPGKWHDERAWSWRQSAEETRRTGSHVYLVGAKGPVSAEECDRQAEICEAHTVRAAQWEALPLIVLAGLR